MPESVQPDSSGGAVPLESHQLAQPEEDMTNDAEAFDEGPVEEPLRWQASEYVHHHKGPGWYVGLGGVMLVLLVLAYLFKLWLSIAVFVAMGAAIVVYAHRPPRILTYELDGNGVTIEGKHYPYRNFRSYGVVSDVEWHSIDLEPVQRFMPRLTMLFGDDDYDAIVEHLALHLPRVDHDPDAIDRLSRYLRF